MHILWRFNNSAEQYFKRIRKEQKESRVVDVSSNRQMECRPQKFFRCGYEDHMIAEFPKQVCFFEKVDRACDTSANNSDCRIYAYMARMSSNNQWENNGTLSTEPCCTELTGTEP